LTLSDLLVRRMPLIYTAPDQGLTVAPPLAEYLATPLGWDEQETARQLAAYREEVALTNLFRRSDR
ncbi:MAG TPA: hypothetical protein VM537_32910, partial [Anaerolineae bacterium]|nr:hypothetical protein [Anaerolineae bacterium]